MSAAHFALPHNIHLKLCSCAQASWEVMQPLVSASGFQDSGAAGAMGVYVGIQQMEYGSLAALHLGTMGAFTATGTPFSVAAGRLSFHYGLKGNECEYLLQIF